MSHLAASTSSWPPICFVDAPLPVRPAGLALPARALHPARRRARRCGIGRGKGLPVPGAERVSFGADIEHLSLAIAIVLIGAYVFGLLFSLKTHRKLFNPQVPPDPDAGEPWSFRRALAVLAIAGVAVAGM